MPPREHVQSLLRDLEHGSHAAQLEAVHHLRRMAYPEVAEAMIRKLRANTWTDVRAEVASCLDAVEDARAVAALLSVLNEESEIRDAALASLRRLVEPDTLLLLRLTRAQLDPDIRQKAARGAASAQAVQGAPGRRLDPVQRWATAILTDLRDHGTPEAIPRLITVLEHEKTDPRYLSLVVEALVGIAGRHPHVDLRSAYVLVQKHALTAPSATKHREILRQFETLTGATLPRPAVPSPAHGPNLPIPACQTSSVPLLSNRTISQEAPAPSPAVTLKQRIPPVPSLRGDLLGYTVGVLILPLAYCLLTYSHDNSTPHLNRAAVMFLLIMLQSILHLIFAFRYTLPREGLSCDGQHLTVVRQLGTWKWQHRTVLAPGKRVYCITQRRPFLKRILAPEASALHLACLGADGRPFRFAHNREPAELERLTAEINAYLEQLESRPTASTGTEHPTDTNECVTVSRTAPKPTGPAPVNRHAR